MLNRRYAEASVEVLDILEHMNANDLAKVSNKFMDFLKENASKNYKCNFDYSKKLNDMQLKKETRGLLALMYEKYWCPEDEKQNLQKKFFENEQKYQKELREKYNPDNLFKRTVIVKDEEELEENNADKMLAVIKKENIVKRIINRIKDILQSKKQ